MLLIESAIVVVVLICGEKLSGKDGGQRDHWFIYVGIVEALTRSTLSRNLNRGNRRCSFARASKPAEVTLHAMPECQQCHSPGIVPCRRIGDANIGKRIRDKFRTERGQRFVYSIMHLVHDIKSTRMPTWLQAEHYGARGRTGKPLISSSVQM